MIYSQNITKRQRRNRQGQTILSRWWYGRAKEEGAKAWRWVKLYEDETASNRAWVDIKARQDQIDTGVISIEGERLKLPLQAIIDDYHKALVRKGLSADHIAISKSVLGRAIKLGGWSRWRDLTVARVESMLDLLDEAGLTVSYRNKFVMRLKAFVRWALPEGYANPLSKLSRISEKGAKRNRARRAASVADLSLLFSMKLPAYRRLAYALAAYNGLRRNEIGRLTWADIDVDANPPTLTLRQKMGEDYDVVPVHPFVMSLLADRSGNGPLVTAVPDVSTLQRDLAAAKVVFKDARGARLDFHALRHTFSSALSRAGASRSVQRAMMRHSHVTVTDRYTHSELIEMSQILACIPWPRKVDAQMDHSKEPVRHSSAGSQTISGVDLTQISAVGTLSSDLAGYPSGLSGRSKSPLNNAKNQTRTHQRTIDEKQRQGQRLLARAFVRLLEKSEPPGSQTQAFPLPARTIGGGK